MKTNPLNSSFTRLNRYVSIVIIGAALSCLQPTVRLLAQAPLPAMPITQQGQYAVAERGINHRVWQQITWFTNEAGTVRARTNSYTELATAMAHPVNGQLVDSSDQIQVTADGAEATNSLHHVKFLGNIDSAGAINVTLPDGQHLSSNPLGISYFDTASGKSVMIAEIKDSYGELLPSGREALFPDAFTDFKADVLYETSVSGLEQYVVIRQRPPSPAEWGLDPASTLLQVITEFQTPPTPALAALDGENYPDIRVDFGTMQMVKGSAFAIGAETNRVPVTKQWHVSNGRTFLVEQVPLQAVAAELEALDPPPPGSARLNPAGSNLLQLARGNRLPAPRVALKKTPSLKVVSRTPGGKGFAMDYTLLASQANLTLQSDTTYYVSGIVNINGTLTIEGGTVVKFTNSTASTITSSNLVCKTGSYRVAVFTAKDDNSLGQNIGGSTGNPSGYYGSTALDFSTAPSLPVLSNLRFHYLSNALAGASITLQDAQIVNCWNGIAAGSTQPTLFNVLAYLVNTVFANSSAGTLTGVNVTAHYCTNFFGNTTGTVNLTNCLFACVTNWQCTTTQTNYDVFLNSDTGIFQTVGTAAHYLAADSPYRNAGTTGVNTSLLADLRKKTTYPPFVLGPQVVSIATTLFPQAQRDTDAIDLGVHYDPIDFALSGFYATNAPIAVNPGTAIGVYGTNAYTYGFGFAGNSIMSCQGAPNNLVEVVAFNTVQEQANTNWSTPSYALVTDEFSGANLGIYCRFTDFSVMAQDVPHAYVGNTTPVSFQDCQFHGGFLDTYYPTLNLTNCLLERVYADLEPLDGNTPLFRNNLVWNGTFLYAPAVNTTLIQDNLFDHPSIPNYIGGGGYTYNGGFNAFITGCDRLQPTFATDIILSASPSYQTGPLGSYYLLSSSVLINADTNTTADKVGLYHYTVMTNLQIGYEIKETNSLLDVSYHYVATDANGNPIDTNGDGIPDYLSDVNGNGTVDSGEIGWNITGDLGLSVTITRPDPRSNVP